MTDCGLRQHLTSGPGSHVTSHVIHRHHTPEEGEDEELDPRIQVELEKLNIASEEINRLEIQLDDARAAFRQVLSDSTQRLNGLAKKLGTCVDKARPYYEARMRLKEAHLESQKAALRFERACSMHEAAKEMVQLAEEGYKRREQDLDPTWQEMLNHATMKVNDAERERMESESCHQTTTLTFKRRDDEVQKLQRDLKRMITKSRPYFEMKAKFNQVMEEHKRSVSQLEDDVASAKSLYSQALRSLEAISDDIHRTRVERQQQQQLGERGAGVGAEAPEPPPNWGEKGVGIDGSAQVTFLEDEQQSSKLDWDRKQETGTIVSHNHQYRRLASLKGKPTSDPDLTPDPLNLVVFKDKPTDMASTAATFIPPSIIKPNPELARNSSYRAAIDGQSNTEPGSTAHQTTDTEPSDSSLPDGGSDYGELSLRRAAEWVEKSPVPVHRGVTKSRSLVSQGGEMSPIVATSISVDLPDSSPPDKQDRALGDMTRGASPVTHLASSSGRSPKLQGLILRVDAVGSSPPPTVPSPRIFTAGQQAAVTPGFTVSHQSNNSSLHQVTSPRTPRPSPLSPQSPQGHLMTGGHHKLLSVPSEHSSDTESIASTGPMLDDDQVELLTLDFTESSITDTADLVNPRHRTSLPPNLSHLKVFLERSPGEGGCHGDVREITDKSNEMESSSRDDYVNSGSRLADSEVSMSVEIRLDSRTDEEKVKVSESDLDRCSVEATVSISQDDGISVVQCGAPLATSEELDAEDVFV